jgi:hypothetical protein
MASHSSRKSTKFEFQRGQRPCRTCFGGVIDPAEIISAVLVPPLKLPDFFERNYEILQQFKNFTQNFTGFIDLAKTILAGSLTLLKRF